MHNPSFRSAPRPAPLLHRLERPIIFACEWLPNYLTDGPHPAADVYAAAEAECITRATLRRAKLITGTISWKPTAKSPWYWICTDWLDAWLHGEDQRAQGAQNEYASVEYVAPCDRAALPAFLLARRPPPPDPAFLAQLLRREATRSASGPYAVDPRASCHCSVSSVFDGSTPQ